MNYKRLTINIVSHLLSLLIIMISIIVVFIIAGSIAGEIYDMQHAIPDPVERGEDLGAGLIVIFYGGISLVVSSILSLFLYKRLFKVMLKLIG